MKDFNFFSTFQQQARASSLKKTLAIACVLIFILSIGGVYALVYMEAENMDVQVSEISQQLQAPELNDALRQVREDRGTLQVVQGYYEAVDAVLLDLSQGDVINTSFLILVNQAIPGEIVLRNMTVSQAALSLNGVADSRVTIAEFYRSMMNLDVFAEIHIASITEVEIVEEDEEDEGDEEETPPTYEYTFSMQCVIKGGGIR